MKTQTEIILTFGLSPEQAALVKSLVASFDIDTVPLTIGTVRSFVKNNPTKKICLVLYKVDSYQPHQRRIIQLIRDFVGPLVPFLALIPRENLGELKKYLEAGVDDYCTLPINENQFSISFLILLEMGQALGQAKSREATITPEMPLDQSANPSLQGWDRVVDYFQGGLGFFTPKSLIRMRKTEKISDRWQQIRRLGVGGFGTVWLVKEFGSPLYAVAKTPHSPAMNISVLRSAAILKRLVHHQNIVQLIEVIKEDGKFILIQEYAEGPTLQALLEKGIAPADKENYFLQIVSAVSYAHSHKILHRDIKPENIIITKEGIIKLLDFGIARDLSWQTADSSSAGTINFMPPEQFAGKSCIASDVWALGVILYIFATNAVPYFQCNNYYPQDIETTVESRAPHLFNPNIDRTLERIIMQCLQKDLQKRYQNATELESDLRQHLPHFGDGALLPL